MYQTTRQRRLERIAKLHESCEALKVNLEKFNPNHDKEDGQFTSGPGGSSSSDSKDSGSKDSENKDQDEPHAFWKWGSRILTVASIASLAIPGVAGLRAGKAVIDGARALAGNLRFISGGVAALPSVSQVLAVPQVRTEAINKAIKAITDKVSNLKQAGALEALSAVFGYMAEKRKEEISKAAKKPKDQILAQIEAILSALKDHKVDEYA